MRGHQSPQVKNKDLGSRALGSSPAFVLLVYILGPSGPQLLRWAVNIPSRCVLGSDGGSWTHGSAELPGEAQWQPQLLLSATFPFDSCLSLQFCSSPLSVSVFWGQSDPKEAFNHCPLSWPSAPVISQDRGQSELLPGESEGQSKFPWNLTVPDIKASTYPKKSWFR